MDLPCRWEMLLISLWIQVSFIPGIHCKDGAVNHLSREDVLLLKDEPDPKCFTRTEQDFTCFFETADNRTYDLFYRVYREKRCEMFVQRSEERTFLHICSFPPTDVYSFIETHVEVVERNTNSTIYSRTVSVEDHLLLDPPFSVSLHQDGPAGQLQVSWLIKVHKHLEEDLMYRIRYSCEGLGEKIIEAKEGEVLDSLDPGEEVEVQVAVRYALNPEAGHWSSWSQPVRAVVPQHADDISLTCFTSDLRYFTCQWNGSRYGEEKEYKLFYKMGFSEALGWTDWTECLADGDVTEGCRFHGDESKKFRVKVSSTSAPLSRTFYTPEFTLNKSIKTSPPRHLRGGLEKHKLCLRWDAPLLFLSTHLQYEVSYQSRGGGAWMTVSLKGPETSTCLEVPTGSQYSVKFRAKPNGSVYSGYWSDWSDVLTGDTPTDIGLWLVLCIPVLMLIIGIIFISLFSTYFSKLKLYLWPPVPNLDKVLQGFLTEVNGPKWNPPPTVKQYSDENTSSVVEVLSEDEGPGSGETRSWRGGQVAEVFPDYVSLNKDSLVLCPKGNSYVCEEVSTEACDGSVCIPSCSDSDFINHSYFPLADCKVNAERGPGNLYTNFPCG